MPFRPEATFGPSAGQWFFLPNQAPRFPTFSIQNQRPSPPFFLQHVAHGFGSPFFIRGCSARVLPPPCAIYYITVTWDLAVPARGCIRAFGGPVAFPSDSGTQVFHFPATGRLYGFGPPFFLGQRLLSQSCGSHAPFLHSNIGKNALTLWLCLNLCPCITFTLFRENECQIL